MNAKLITLTVLSLFLVSCAGKTSIAEPARADTRSELDELARQATAELTGAPDQQPAFTQATVLRLNPIMKRSMSALDRFEAILPEYQAAQKRGDKTAVEAFGRELLQFQKDALRARDDFAIEEMALRSRDEHYDEIILATMKLFVTEAPIEIGDALN